MDKQIDKATIRRRRVRAMLPWAIGSALVLAALIWMLAAMEKTVSRRDRKSVV